MTSLSLSADLGSAAFQSCCKHMLEKKPTNFRTLYFDNVSAINVLVFAALGAAP